MKKHVVVDARMIAHSGIGTYIRSVLPLIAARGTFRLSLMGPVDLLEKHASSIPAGKIPMGSPIYKPREQWELPLKIPSCDLFWSPHFNVPLAPIRATRRLVSICDAYHLAHPKSFGPVARLYAKILFRKAVDSAHRIITISEFSRSEIARLAGGAGKLKVIPLAVDPGFNKSYEPRPIPDDYLLFVGNLKPNKNLGNLLRAFARIAGHFPDLKLYVVGRVEGFMNPDNEFQSLLQSLPEGRVKVVGEVSFSDLKNYYANAKLFVFPSRYEGFGLPLLEAMTFGLPIVSSSAGPLKEVGGDSVRYFDPENVVEMAETIREALVNPSPNRAEAYRKRLDRFTWEACAETHLEVIESCLADRDGSPV